MMKAAISPGPLAPYNVEKAAKIYMGKQSPRLTISKKFTFTNPNEAVKTPGPGAYTDKLRDTFNNPENGPKGYTMGMKLRIGNIMNSLESERIPGPG